MESLHPAPLPTSQRLRRDRNLGVLLFILLLAFGRVHGESSGLRVRIDTGTLEGSHFGSDPYAREFLAIPYAAPPVGRLRWRPPQARATWRGIRGAKDFGPACPQLPSSWLPEMLGRNRMQTDEGCLYLNVWTTQRSAKSKAPVMVWIHGGGNVEGSQEWPPLGPTLAKRGVVVVSINYRLGVFGFLAHPALTAESAQHVSGNYGLLDQIAALRWVQRNIDKFGGNPANVTVFGASSGSLDICDLMASPLAGGLFQKAILQSGVSVDSRASTLTKAEASGKQLAQFLGIAEGAQSLDKLRAVPAEELLQRAAADKEIGFDPVVDGWVLPDQPSRIFSQGKQAQIPVIVGSNSDEVSIFASPIVGGRSFRPKSVAEYQHWLQDAFHDLAAEMLAAYPANSDSEVPKAFLNLDSDYEFGFGAWLLAREMEDVGQPAYLYRFTYVGSGKFAALGAFHSEESMFLSKRYWTSWVSSPEDQNLSEVLIAYWTDFAKSSKPGSPGIAPWPPYDPATDQCQELGMRVGQIPTPRSVRFNVFLKLLDNDQ